MRTICGLLSLEMMSYSLMNSLRSVIDATIGLRVTQAQERDGLDVSEHGETAYN
jgi:Amt family ammonium transporter